MRFLQIFFCSFLFLFSAYSQEIQCYGPVVYNCFGKVENKFGKAEHFINVMKVDRNHEGCKYAYYDYALKSVMRYEDQDIQNYIGMFNNESSESQTGLDIGISSPSRKNLILIIKLNPSTGLFEGYIQDDQSGTFSGSISCEKKH